MKNKIGLVLIAVAVTCVFLLLEETIASWAARNPSVRNIIEMPVYVEEKNLTLKYPNWLHPREAIRTPEYFYKWSQMYKPYICLNSNIIDIGAHSGDTAIMFLMTLGQTGTVFAFEPAQPFTMLQVTVSLNPEVRIVPYHFAIAEEAGDWWYSSTCKGCNGKQAKKGVGSKLHAEEPKWIKDNLRPEELARVGLIKIDAEGFDHTIVRAFKQILMDIAPLPLIIVEWFRGYYTCETSSNIWISAAEIGYAVYTFDGQQKLAQCDMSFKQANEDLLLVPLERGSWSTTSDHKLRWCSVYKK